MWPHGYQIRCCACGQPTPQREHHDTLFAARHGAGHRRPAALRLWRQDTAPAGTATNPSGVRGNGPSPGSAPHPGAGPAELAAEAEVFFCEAIFSDEDQERAEQRQHLTASQAGLLAREAGAQRLVLFHFSPKYHGKLEPLYEEASRAFGKEVE